MFFMRTGTCSVIKVGKLSVDSSEIDENVMTALSGDVDIVPNKWKYIRSLYLKLSESLALPIYQAVLDSENQKDLKEEKNGEITSKSDVDDSKSDQGNVSMKTKKKKKKKKGRIHEVRYMDSNVSEILGEDEIDVKMNDKPAMSEKPLKKKVIKGKKSDIVKLKENSKNGLNLKKLKTGRDESGGGLKAKMMMKKSNCVNVSSKEDAE